MTYQFLFLLFFLSLIGINQALALLEVNPIKQDQSIR